MNNKNDWDELEQWNQTRIENEKEKYGFDSDKINTENQKKKVDKVVKGIRLTGKISMIFIIFLILIIVFIVSIILNINYSNIKSGTNIDVIETIENKYQTKIEVIRKEVDEHENGKYLLKVKNKDIQFTAIKEYGSLSEDFSARSHKYYFDLWDSENKNDFTIDERIENDLLYYDTYIEDFSNLEEATNKIIDFVNFCGEDFRANWNIYLKKNDIRIYPYQNSGITPEEAMYNARQLYNKYF